MHAAAEYRKYAQECKYGARLATSDVVKVHYLELAKLWLAAAAQIELRGNGKTTWPKSDGTSPEPSE
jgi:hypothetical protein